jgi:hypothetical protein
MALAGWKREFTIVNSISKFGGRYPHAPRLDPLRAALARLDAASNATRVSRSAADPKAPPPAKADKRARR